MANNINPYFNSNLGRVNSKVSATNQKQKINSSKTFSEILSRELATKSDLKFSKHAAERMSSRNIVLSSTELSKLNQAMTRVADKGAKESLVIMDQVALVVSVKNNTVITAVDKNSLKDNIFTNIDSAVII